MMQAMSFCQFYSVNTLFWQKVMLVVKATPWFPESINLRGKDDRIKWQTDNIDSAVRFHK